MENKVLTFKKKDVEDLDEFMKKFHGTNQFVLGFVDPDNDMQMITYISNQIKDIDLVYLIQTLKDRRYREFEIN